MKKCKNRFIKKCIEKYSFYALKYIKRCKNGVYSTPTRLLSSIRDFMSFVWLTMRILILNQIIYTMVVHSYEYGYEELHSIQKLLLHAAQNIKYKNI